jgi:hypothetical protein
VYVHISSTNSRQTQGTNAKNKLFENVVKFKYYATTQTIKIARKDKLREI